MDGVLRMGNGRSVGANEIVEVVGTDTINNIRSSPSEFEFLASMVSKLDELANLEGRGGGSRVLVDVVLSLLLGA